MAVHCHFRFFFLAVMVSEIIAKGPVQFTFWLIWPLVSLELEILTRGHENKRTYLSVFRCTTIMGAEVSLEASHPVERLSVKPAGDPQMKIVKGLTVVGGRR